MIEILLIKSANISAVCTASRTISGTAKAASCYSFSVIVATAPWPERASPEKSPSPAAAGSRYPMLSYLENSSLM